MTGTAVRHSIGRRAVLAGAATGAIVLLGRTAGRLSVDAARAAPATLTVVAAENFYGDVIAQIAGGRVSVTSIISDPNTDPHEYESRTRDMAAIGRARLVVINGLGYDGFMRKLINATPNPTREVMDVSRIAGKNQGDNWHIWYDPAVVPKFARAAADFFVRVDPSGAPSYRARLLRFDAAYEPFPAKVSAMRAKFAGAPVGATEPIFENMAAALGMKILTSREFQKAVEEGEDPPARAIAQMQDQLHLRAIKVLIYNVQTVSKVTERIRRDAARLGVPVVGVSETLPPALTYQTWMIKQLNDIEQALHKSR